MASGGNTLGGMTVGVWDGKGDGEDEVDLAGVNVGVVNVRSIGVAAGFG